MRKADVPEVMIVETSDLWAALAAGWRDFRRAPLFGLAIALCLIGGGWLLLWAVAARGQVWWILPAGAGFPLLAPFAAVALYEVSRRLEAGESLSWAGVWRAVLEQRSTQIPSMAAVLMVFFLFWNALAHMIFALFLGNAKMTDVSSSLGVLVSAQGLAMLAFGTVLGAAIATLLYAMSVVSLPMLMQREVDFVTASLTSISVVRESPVVMLGWGALIGLMLFVSMLPGFAGLLVTLPVLGHASWHLYRRAIGWADEQA